MRTDKFFTSAGILSRTECAKACKAGRITSDGQPVRDASAYIDPEKNVVALDGRRIEYKRFVYVMLNKPEGYVSSLEQAGQRVVTELLPPELRRRGLFPCGRLDKDTLGLMILTDDGESAHRALSPKNHVSKTYRYVLSDGVSEDDIRVLESGVTLADGLQTLKCEIAPEDEKRGLITLHEGKYHQIRRMFASRGDKVVYLERASFGGISLDPALERGEWRYLTDEETEEFTKASSLSL